MRRATAIGLVAAGLLLTGIVGTHRYRKGIIVEPVAVGDFNNDGKEDLLYRDTPLGTYTDGIDGLHYLDSSTISKKDEKYLKHATGRQTGYRLIKGKGFLFTPTDYNRDGNLDLFVTDPNLTDFYFADMKTVLLGDGKGNFIVSPDCKMLDGIW